MGLNRLPKCRYGAGSRYFVTFCTHERRPVLSSVCSGLVILTPLGELFAAEWAALPEQYPGVSPDEMAVMPDHVHALLVFGPEATPTLFRIIGRLKGVTTTLARRAGIWGSEPLWQRSFHDRVVRSDGEMNRIRGYTRKNPIRLEWPDNDP